MRLGAQAAFLLSRFAGQDMTELGTLPFYLARFFGFEALRRALSRFKFRHLSLLFTSGGTRRAEKFDLFRTARDLLGSGHPVNLNLEFP